MRNITYISAGAGSGKTYRLTEILTGLIKSGKVRPEQVILTTFTTKAANEFKEKAKAALIGAGLYDDAVKLDHAMIGTVHSVCQRMIGKYWFSLGLAPNMGVMTEEDSEYYISQSLSDLPTETELTALHEFSSFFDVHKQDGDKKSYQIDYDIWRSHLRDIIGFATNYEIEDFKESEKKSIEYIHQFVCTKDVYNFSYDELKAVVDEHTTFLKGYRQSDANDKRIESLKAASRNLRKPTIGTLTAIASTIGTPKGYGPLAAAFSDKIAGIWTSKTVYEREVEYIKLLFILALRWKERFAQFKRERNLLDFNDMEKYMRKLMQDKAVKKELSLSYRYLFVDEFQDSSPIQVKIFNALSDLMEHSYWVGDYKQAIYGFRGSDTALTKAVVERIAKGQDGCETETLEISWRSLPEIVEVDNAVFGKTFAGILDDNAVKLKPHRTNSENVDSLRYFITKKDDEVGLAGLVLKLLKSGAKPCEIAVLSRQNKHLDPVASSLKRLNIPSSRECRPITGSSAYTLVSSLLRIIENPKDALAKATVAILTQAEYNTKRIIEAKILHNSDTSATKEDYLADIPLISQLISLRPRLLHKSLASLVESLIIELKLYDLVKNMDDDVPFGISCLQTIIKTARTYEDHCIQMNLPSTIDGFISHMDSTDLSGEGDPNGVQLHTYHSCKGLQWKYVILTSLNDNVADKQRAIRRELFGIHTVYTEKPSAENQYPDVFIRLTPWIYGNKTTVPAKIGTIIEASEDFKNSYRAMLEEANRLLYVGMTRASDVLILNLEGQAKSSSLMSWPRGIGVDKAVNSIPSEDECDIFGIGRNFKNLCVSTEELLAMGTYEETDPAESMPLNIGEPTFEERAPRYLSPSKIHEKGEVLAHQELGKRIPFGAEPSDMSKVGDCIHQIFAGIDQVSGTEALIRSYGLSAVLTDKEPITAAWRNLTSYLSEHYGPSVRTCHERPFRLERDGQIVIGSIDLVWQTSDGDILIDFKTCPMGPKAVLDPESDHYAGWYAGQLHAYEDALTAAGEKVLKKYIYYPVSGLIAEIS